MEAKKVKDLKAGEYFTLNPVESPNESIVWIRGNYERSLKKYSATKWSDICHEHFFSGEKIVYVDFFF